MHSKEVAYLLNFFILTAVVHGSGIKSIEMNWIHNKTFMIRVCSWRHVIVELSFFTIISSHHIEPQGEQSPPLLPLNTTFQRSLYLASLPNTTSPSAPAVRSTRPLLLPLPNTTLFPPWREDKVKHPQSDPSLPSVFPHALLRKHLSDREIRV